MMQTDTLVKNLQSSGVKISFNGESLKIDAPKGKLTPEVKELLRVHKTEIIRQLIETRTNSPITNPFSAGNESGLRVINYLESFNNKFDGKGFFPCAPSIEAYESEKALCVAIFKHEQGIISNYELKAFVEDYIKTHSDGRDNQNPWTGEDVPLYHVQLFLNGERVEHENYTCNEIQSWILEAFWLKRHAECSVEITRIPL